jgi:hypothetical protein
MRATWARFTVQTRNDRGVALFAAIAGMVLLSTMIAALVILARNENLIAQLNKDEAQAAYAAEAGANWGRKILSQRLSVDLPAKVVAEPRASMRTALQTTYNSMNGAAQFIREFAVPASGPTFAACTDCVEPTYSVFVPKEIPDAQQAVLTLTCPGTTGCPSGMAFTTRVVVGAHPTIPPQVMNGENRALFTYVWRIESSGTSGRARQQWVIHDSSVPDNQAGSFTIAVTAEFVKYAHFIDQFQDAGGGEPWMSFRHLYTGPVHTNTRFSILGNTAVKGQEGPTFRSEATQTMETTRFNNGGSATNLKQDSSAKDWPKLGPDPGIFCKLSDCSGFTRAFDFDPRPAAPGIQPIPFPSDPNGPDRRNQVCLALGVAAAACTGTVASLVATLCSTAHPVIVSNNCTADPVTKAAGNLAGGVFVYNDDVRDLLLAHTATGQTIVIYTSSSQRTVIEEGQPIAGQTRVRRECRKAAGALDGGVCDSTGTEWYLLGPTHAAALFREQIFDGVFSPTPAIDRGVIYVADGPGSGGNIGQTGTAGDPSTLRGLRRGTFQTLPSNTNGGIDLSPLYAIYQDTADASRGMRLTVAADGNIWIAGPLNYRVEPRGPDAFFSDPIPGDDTGTSTDDEMDVQNALGIVSWGAGMAGGVRLSAALDGNLATHGMVFVANLNGNGEPSGQFSFDDPNGAYRGISTVIGGVVQKTMGTFGQPGSNLGYARDWIYDERFRYRALSPPAFPGFPNFTAATSLGIDSYTWRLGLF